MSLMDGSLPAIGKAIRTPNTASTATTETACHPLGAEPRRVPRKGEKSQRHSGIQIPILRHMVLNLVPAAVARAANSTDRLERRVPVRAAYSE
jgi:hypothetical protein